eukprot:8066-Pelagomonas_calceolata.AAC.3
MHDARLHKVAHMRELARSNAFDIQLAGQSKGQVISKDRCRGDSGKAHTQQKGRPANLPSYVARFLCHGHTSSRGALQLAQEV